MRDSFYNCAIVASERAKAAAKASILAGEIYRDNASALAHNLEAGERLLSACSLSLQAASACAFAKAYLSEESEKALAINKQERDLIFRHARELSELRARISAIRAQESKRLEFARKQESSRYCFQHSGRYTLNGELLIAGECECEYYIMR